MHPATSDTPAALPARIASSGGSGSTVPSTTGWNVSAPAGGPPSRPSGVWRRASTAAWAASTASTGASSTPSTAVAGDRPSSVSTCSVAHSAASAWWTCAVAPLCAIALRNSPDAAGVPSSVPTLIAAGRLAEDRDVAGVAAEGRRCCRAPTRGPPPGRGCRWRPSRPGSVEVGQVQEPEHAEPVVDRDDDGVAPPGEVGAVVPGHAAGAGGEAAAVDPHQHRAGSAVGGRREHVEEQAVLARRPVLGAQHGLGGRGVLGGDGAELGGVADAVPALDPHGRPEPLGGGVADAAELPDVPLLEALDAAGRCVDDHTLNATNDLTRGSGFLAGPVDGR